MRTRIVPVEPTEEMVEAYFKACEKHGFHHSINATTAYAAMLTAAPPVREELVEKVVLIINPTGALNDDWAEETARAILALINGESE